VAAVKHPNSTDICDQRQHRIGSAEMTNADLLADAFGRIRESVHQVVDRLSTGDLTYRIADDANSIAWLIWHLTRIQDDHIAEVAGSEQVWLAAGWASRFGLALADADTGYGHRPDQVARVVCDSQLLDGYHAAVYEATLRFVANVSDADLDRIVDERWNPPVTLGVRLVSVIQDDLEHVGQAAYVRGIIERRR
jgi:uncharacterized damage-inducible protein DinB